MKVFKFLAIAAVVIGASAPQFAAAESAVVSTGSAAAKLNFKVTIPRVLFLQVGTGTLGAGATIDEVAFAPTAADLLAGTANLAGTGGDLTAGAVSVRLFANTGDVTLGAAGNTSGMQIGSTGVFLPWSQITATAAAGTAANGFTATSIPHPAINGSTQTITATAGVVKQAAKWTFTYNNSVAYGPGVYTGQVTYTASAP